MPQSVIGSLRVNLGLDSAQFEQGARRAMSSSDVMQARFATLARSAAAITAGVGAAVAGIGALATSSANAAREVQTFSRLSNTNSQIFQQWAFGARSVGIEQDKLSDILKDVNDRVGDFIQTGGGPMADFFEKVAPKVGVTAEQFRKLSGPDALQLYVSSLEKAGASQQEVTFYLEAMSSESTALLPLLSNNGAEMARLGQRAEELGAVMSEEAIASLNEARIALGESAAAWTGLGQTIGAAAAPALEAAARASTTVATALQPMVQVLGEASQYFGQLATVAGTAAALFGARLAISVGTTYVTAAVAAVRQSVALEMALGATSRSAALASVGIKGVSTALRAIKGALISTGIGALVVLAGEAVYWFGRLVSASGGFGAALGMLGDVAAGVWQGIIDSASAVPPALDGVWSLMKAGFLDALAAMADEANRFMNALSGGLAEVPGMSGLSTALLDAAVAAGEAASDLGAAGRTAREAAGGAFSEAARTISDAFGPAREAVGALVDTVSAASEETAGGVEAADRYAGALAGIGGSGADGSGGSAGKAAKAVEKLRDQVKQLELDADPVKKYTAELAELDTLLDHGLSQGAYDKAVGKLNDELADSLPLVGDLTSEFSSFLQSGLSDFQGFVDGIWGSFTSLISNMIATAARNQIIVGLGFGGAGTLAGTAATAGASALAGGGGLLGSGAGLLGGIGSFVSGIGSGASAALGIGGFSSAGLFNVTANAATAAATGVSGLAATLGAVAAPLAIVAGAVSFFRKKTTELDSGIRVTVSGMDALVETFKKTKTSRFWGLSSSIDKSYKAASAAISDPISAAVASVGESVAAVADSLQLSSDALADVSYQFKISTKDLSSEELASAIETQMAALGNRAAEAIVAGFGERFADMQLAGEEAFDTLQRLSEQLYSVNAVFDTLGTQMFYIGLQGADMASQLVQLFGSLDTFTSATSTYYQAFYGEAERLAILTRQTTEALDGLGYAMPETREQFRAMVEGLDLTTESGRETYAALVSMAGALDGILPAVNDFASILSGLVGETSSAISVMISEASSMAASAAQAASDWLSAADTLRDFLRDLTSASSSALSPSQQLAALSRDLGATFAAARGGDLDAARAFGGVADSYLDAARRQATSALEYRRIESSVRAQANLLAGISELEGAAQSAVEYLAQQQVDVLKELNDYIQSTDSLTPEDLSGFEDRLGSLQAAIEQAELFSYDYLKERLQVTVDLLPATQIPEDVKALISAAATGIDSTIEFAVRASDLTPDLRWLAITQASEHLKTIDFTLGDDLDDRTRRLALDQVADLTRTINLVMGSDLSRDEMSVALAGSSELSRVVNVALSSGADQQAIRIALENVGTYSVAVRTSLAASSQVRKVVFGNAGSYAAMIEAAFSADLTAAARRVLLEQQGTYAVTINGLLNSAMGDNLRLVLMNASTSAVRAVTVGMAFAGTVTAAQRRLLLLQGETILRTISAMVTFSGLGAQQANFLSQVSMGGGSVARGIVASVNGNRIGLGGWNVINQLAAGGGNVSRTLVALMNGGGIGQAGWKFVNQLAAGAGSIDRVLKGSVDISGLSASQVALLNAVSGNSAGSIRIGGTFTFDPSSAFSSWYEAATKASIAAPMNNLRVAIANLRSGIIANKQAVEAQTALLEKQAKVDALQNQLAAAVQNRGTGGQSIVDAINRLEASTGVNLMNGSGDEILYVDENGKIQYQATHYRYESRDDLAGFRAAFYGATGLQQKIYDYNSSVVAEDKVIATLRKQIEAMGGVPAFARGGLHTGGLRLVGERGPELEVTGPARYYSAPQTRSLLDRGEELSELRRLRSEMAEMRDTMTQLGLRQSRDLSKLRKLAEKDDVIGTPPERSTA